MSDRLQIIQYDGYNIFLKGKWTTLDYVTLEEAQEVVKVLEPLTFSEIQEFIYYAKVTDTNNDVWNILKKVKYNGMG